MAQVAIDPTISRKQGRQSDHSTARADRWLKGAALACFLAIAAGQMLFVVFILAFYYPSTLGGRFADWNKRPLIDGFIAGDGAGNLLFAAHVLLAGLITAGGIAQLVPAVRGRAPAVHRWNGRLYVSAALLIAAGGLWLVWVRGTYLNIVGAIGITLDALLIILCAALAWRAARRRRIAAHRRWALRLFAVVSAVWFMRVGYVSWGLLTGGAGVGETMDGWFDHLLAFGCSLVPLAVAEAYLRAPSGGSGRRYAVAALLVLCTAVVAIGSGGAWLMMWSPYL